jgi:hypothetical protein
MIVPMLAIAAVTIAAAALIRLTESDASLLLVLLLLIDSGLAILIPPLAASRMSARGRRPRLSIEELLVPTLLAWGCNIGIVFVTGAIATTIVPLHGIC